MPGWKLIPEKILRAFFHLFMLLVFMSIPDHWMRATYDSVWVGMPVLVNTAGSLVYLGVVHLARAVFRGRSGLTSIQ